MPSRLVVLPVASPVACTFSGTLPVACKLLSREMSQSLMTLSQMASADLPLHMHTCTHACTHAHMHTCTHAHQQFGIMIQEILNVC